MWKRIRLRARIYMILSTLVFITVLGGLIMIWYTYRVEGLLTNIIDRNMAAFQAAAALETALVNQKGFVSYYFQDGDPGWLRQLGEFRQIFKERLKKARSLAGTEVQKKAINRIENEYTQYVLSKDRVIALYKAGQREAGMELHKKVRKHFFKVLELCEAYKNIYKESVREAGEESHSQARDSRIIAVTAMVLVTILSALLATVFVTQILAPLRKLTLEADQEREEKKPEDEVKALSLTVRGLIQDRDLTHIELEKSRETLLQAEKMAVVGKLAAGMAHSIRNPLTSVKMRLFSLNRTLSLSAYQKEDFEVISEEIRHIDTIVQNFLEFSRPPKLKMQKISPSEVVDMVLQLLRHRLDSYNVKTSVSRQNRLPEISVDPEQLKEVLVNLIENACQAMGRGGAILVEEKEAVTDLMGRAVVIRLSDNGPGIPESIQEKVLQPFFSTKEEGTGLGLSIALRIIQEHGGTLSFTSREGEGTTFFIHLPLKESDFEPNPYH
ncbi:MAG: ATP-binding protein [Pseudomonadota bacterium]